jgi:hypothetical protein
LVDFLKIAGYGVRNEVQNQEKMDIRVQWRARGLRDFINNMG